MTYADEMPIIGNFVRINDAISAIEQARQALGDKDLSEVEADNVLLAALLWWGAIVGEALHYVKPEFKELHSDIEWTNAKSFRNRLIHKYSSINTQIIYDTIKTNFLELEKKLKVCAVELYTDMSEETKKIMGKPEDPLTKSIQTQKTAERACSQNRATSDIAKSSHTER